MLRDAENANSKPDKMIKCKCWTTVTQLLQCGQNDNCPHMRNFQIKPAFGNKYAEYNPQLDSMFPHFFFPKLCKG